MAEMTFDDIGEGSDEGRRLAIERARERGLDVNAFVEWLAGRYTPPRDVWEKFASILGEASAPTV